MATILFSIEHFPAEDKIIQIFVKTLTGKHLTLDVNQNHTVISLKKLIEKQENIPIDQQRLVFDGKQLEDEIPLCFYGIKEDSTLHLVLNLRG